MSVKLEQKAAVKVLRKCIRFLMNFEYMIARIISILDARALDLDLKQLETRMNLLVLATSLLFTVATTAAFTDSISEPTNAEYMKIAEDIVGVRKLYAHNGKTIGTFSEREIERAEKILAKADGNLTSTAWDDNMLTTYFSRVGSAQLESFTWLMVATIISVVGYFMLVMIRHPVSARPRKNRIQHSGNHPRYSPKMEERFPYNILYYVQLFGTLFSIYAFINGIVQANKYMRYRIMIVQSSSDSQYTKMILQDFFDPLVDGSTLKYIGLLVGTIVALLVTGMFVNVVELIRDCVTGNFWTEAQSEEDQQEASTNATMANLQESYGPNEEDLRKLYAWDLRTKKVTMFRLLLTASITVKKSHIMK